LHEALLTYIRPHVLVIDEVGYLTYSQDAANVLFHVVNERHLRKRPMIFTTNKPLSEWGKVLHDEDLAAAILDRVLERGRFIHLDGPSGRTRHLNLEEVLPEKSERVRISGNNGSEFPEPTTLAHALIRSKCRCRISRLMKLRLAANLCRVCINQLQKGAKDNGRVRFFPCGDKLDPDIIWLQTVEPDTI
jgi:hypothetical protein